MLNDTLDPFYYFDGHKSFGFRCNCFNYIIPQESLDVFLKQLFWIYKIYSKNKCEDGRIKYDFQVILPKPLLLKKYCNNNYVGEIELKYKLVNEIDCCLEFGLDICYRLIVAQLLPFFIKFFKYKITKNLNSNSFLNDTQK